MSQRHQSRRRRSYGRRQHEVRERRGRREGWSTEIDADGHSDETQRTPAALGDLFTTPFRLAEGT